METKLDSYAGGPTAGHVGMQRLTRKEFAAAVGDLLGIELDASQLLPAEIEVNGFDNIAAALSVSPAFLDQYVAAARYAARLALGEVSLPVSVSTGELRDYLGRPRFTPETSLAAPERRTAVPGGGNGSSSRQPTMKSPATTTATERRT